MSLDQYRPMGFKLLPPVVKNLLIINILFFLATLSLHNAFRIDLTDILGLHFPTASKFQPYQFVTYMFMHDPTNFMHIIFNMFALWMFGYALENYWGGKKFLIYFFVTGIGAALTHYLVMYFAEISPVTTVLNAFLSEPSLPRFQQLSNSDAFQSIISYLKNDSDFRLKLSEFTISYNQLVGSDPDKALQLAIDFTLLCKQQFLNAPLVVGASGAVYGILLAFGMLFPNTLILIYFFFPIKAKWFVILYGALELYSGVTDRASNVAHFAHLGGMIFGFLLIKYWNRRPKYFP